MEGSRATHPCAKCQQFLSDGTHFWGAIEAYLQRVLDRYYEGKSLCPSVGCGFSSPNVFLGDKCPACKQGQMQLDFSEDDLHKCLRGAVAVVGDFTGAKKGEDEDGEDENSLSRACGDLLKDSDFEVCHVGKLFDLVKNL